mgnify:CR=1 FL=1
MRGAAVWFAAAAGLGCLHPICGGKTPVVPEPSAASIAALPPPAGEHRFLLGINEALAVPSKHRSKGDLPRIEQALARDMESVSWLGADVVRGHTGNFPATSCSDLVANAAAMDDADAWVRAAAGRVALVGMVSPWPGNQTGNATDHYLPDDLDAYRACVRGIVERYDGDGFDDMPGLVGKVAYWEVDNEPDLKNTNVARGAERTYNPRQFALPSEYARVLVASSAAIREADPTAKVLGLGLYRPHAANGRGYLRDVVAHPGALDAIDIVSIHTYAPDDGVLLASGIVATRLAIPGKPLWVTETNADDLQGEAEQARKLAAVVGRAAIAGAEALFWHTLADPPANVDREGPGGMPNSSLFRSLPGGNTEPKPAGQAFRSLSARLRDDNLVGAVAEGAGAARLRSGAILLFGGTMPLQAGQSGMNLVTGQAIAPGAPATAPAWIFPPAPLGQGVTPD